MRRWHLSAAEKKEIARLHLEGARNVDICRQLKLNRNTVHRWLADMGLPITRRPALPENKVLALLRKRVEFRTIGRMLHVSQRSVAEFARAHGFGRPRRVLSTAQAMLVIEDILARNGSASAIAKRRGASYKRVLELAHSLLRCERFLPSCKTPLSSYFPSRGPLSIKREGRCIGSVHQHEETTSLVLRLVDKICNRFLSGTLPVPGDENSFVETLSAVIVPADDSPDLQDCPREAVREYFETHLQEAIGILRQTQASEWAN